MIGAMSGGMYNAYLYTFDIYRGSKIKQSVRILRLAAFDKFFDIGAVCNDIAFIAIVKCRIV